MHLMDEVESECTEFHDFRKTIGPNIVKNVNKNLSANNLLQEKMMNF